MSVIEEVLKNNEDYARNFTLGDLPMPPGRKLAVVACMDARLTVEEVLGLKKGDAHIIRKPGVLSLNPPCVHSLLHTTCWAPRSL